MSSVPRKLTSHPFGFLVTMCNIYMAIGGTAEQPLLGQNGKALNQPKPPPLDRIVPRIELCEVDNSCAKETPEWKAVQAAKALTSWVLT